MPFGFEEGFNALSGVSEALSNDAIHSMASQSANHNIASALNFLFASWSPFVVPYFFAFCCPCMRAFNEQTGNYIFVLPPLYFVVMSYVHLFRALLTMWEYGEWGDFVVQVGSVIMQTTLGLPTIMGTLTDALGSRYEA